MLLSRFQDRLLANNPFSVDLTNDAMCIVDEPLPSEQLDGMVTVIVNGNPVGKYKMRLCRTGIFRLIFRLHTNLYPSGCLRDHVIKNIKFFNIISPSILEPFMDVRIEEGWKKHLLAEFRKPYFSELTQFVRNEYKREVV